MKPYRWSRHICEAANAPSASKCESCGFPAIATGSEIAKAKASPNGCVLQAVPAPKQGAASATLAEAARPKLPFAELEGAELPRKLLGYFGIGLAAVAYFGFQLSMGLVGFLVTVVVFTAGVGLFFLASGVQPQRVASTQEPTARQPPPNASDALQLAQPDPLRQAP